MPRPNRSIRIIACLFLAACSGQSLHPALTQGNMVELLPAHRFAYHGVTVGGHTLSPDGNKLAWFGPSMWYRALFVRDRRSGAVSTHRARGAVRWSADSRWLLYESDTSGAENAHVWAIDTDTAGAQAVDLTPYPGVKASIQSLTEADPAHVQVLHNRRTRKLFDLYRIHLATRTETLVGRNPGDAIAPITQDDGALRGWQRSREVTRAEAQARRPAAAEATPPAGNGGATPPQAGRPPGAGVEDAATLARRAAREARAPESAVRLLGAGPDPQTTWALSNRGRDRAALVLLQARYGWEQVVLEDPDADISQAWISRVSRTPLLAVGNAGYPRTTFLDDALRRELQPLFGRFSGEPLGIDIQGADRAERRLLVRLHTSTWGRTWLVDRDGGKFEPQDGDDDAFTRLLSPMRPFAIKARDGLHLRGFLTLPQGVPPRGLPMVLLVHGGPWAQTLWSEPSRSEDSTRVQFLANRGYAVLQVDFRGSTGYGKAHQHAAIGEFAGRMQDDLSDAVQWAVAQGIADPAKVAIMGLSYGGYAALTGLASTPKTYACGISIGGPTDLATLIESFPPYWKTDLSTWHDFVGDPRIPAERADMTRRSPLTHAARIERPVLIIHGGRDVRVRPDQSQRMAAALAAAGRPVRLVMLPDMGHNPSWWAHQYQVLRETETFLAGCLGGRASAFDWFDPLVWAWTRLSR